jgi:hydroxymethylglutaryl-CoA lyase
VHLGGAAVNKELVRLGWHAPESTAQKDLIKTTFAGMITPRSEGEHGIINFQKKIKSFSWKEFWGGRKIVGGPILGSR